MVFLFDQYNLPDDLFEIVFATEQQVVVAKRLVKELKEKNGVFTKSDMSEFAMKLHDGFDMQVTVNVAGRSTKTTQLVSYNKRQFYDRILTPMKSMGLIDYDLYKKVYKLSDRFAKLMERIGKMWSQEAQSRN